MKTVMRACAVVLSCLLAGIVVPRPAAAAGCPSEGTLFAVQYLGACAYEQSDSFTLASASFVTRIRLWYDTSKFAQNLSVVLTRPDGGASTLATSKGGCQGSWCEGNLVINDFMPAGRYTVATSTTPAICKNPGGGSTVMVYGCSASVAAAGQTFNVTAVTSGSESRLTLDATLTTDAQHVGQAGEIFVGANHANQWYFYTGGAWQTQLTPFFSGSLPASQSIPVLAGMDVSALTGAGVYVGYGLSTAEMLETSRYRNIYTVKGSGSVDGTPFVSTVAATTVTQTVATPDNKVAVAIPGNTLSQAETLTITPELGRTDTTFDRFTNLGVYRIALEKTREFSRNITLEFSFDPAATDPSLRNGGKFITAYYDDALRTWVSVRNTVDVARRKVVVQTNHLSSWGVWMALKGYKAFYQPHFSVYYHPSDTLPAAFGTTTVADFAFALGQACEAAYGAYGAANFRLPGYTADVLVLNKNDAQRLTIAGPGDIEIGFANLRSPEMGYTACGHELFHSVQNETFNLVKAAVSKSHVWLIEGTPDFASWAVGFGRAYAETNVMESGLDADYFLESMFTDKPQHAYQLYFWWKYLDAHRGIRFPDAWNAITANAGLTSATSAQAMQSTVAQRAGVSFASLWSDYVNFSYFDARSDLSWSNFRANTLAYQSNMLSDTTASFTLNYNLAANFTADVRRVTSVAGNKAVAVSTPNNLPDGVSIEAWLLPSDRPNAAVALGGATRAGTLSGAFKSMSFDLNTVDGLYLVTKNTSAAAQGVNVTVATLLPFAITSLSPSTGPVGTTITITGTNFGSTAGTVAIVPTNALGKTATLVSWSDTRIVATVPTGAATGVVVLTKPGGSQTNASNGKVFTVAASAAYVDNGNGTVTQGSAKLVWQQLDDGARRSWDDAVAYCSSLSLGAFSSGWKLPTRTQLVGLIDKARSPTINGLFTNTQASIYWTSSEAGGVFNAYYVDFSDGSSTYTGKNQYDYLVRCVHAAP